MKGDFRVVPGWKLTGGEFNFYKMPDWIMESEDLNNNDRIVYMVLYRRVRADGDVHITNQLLAKLAHISESTVHRCIAALKANNYLGIEVPGPKSLYASNCYYLTCMEYVGKGRSKYMHGTGAIYREPLRAYSAPVLTQPPAPSSTVNLNYTPGQCGIERNSQIDTLPAQDIKGSTTEEGCQIDRVGGVKLTGSVGGEGCQIDMGGGCQIDSLSLYRDLDQRELKKITEEIQRDPENNLARRAYAGASADAISTREDLPLVDPPEIQIKICDENPDLDEVTYIHRDPTDFTKFRVDIGFIPRSDLRSSRGKGATPQTNHSEIPPIHTEGGCRPPLDHKEISALEKQPAKGRTFIRSEAPPGTAPPTTRAEPRPPLESISRRSDGGSGLPRPKPVLKAAAALKKDVDEVIEIWRQTAIRHNVDQKCLTLDDLDMSKARTFVTKYGVDTCKVIISKADKENKSWKYKYWKKSDFPSLGLLLYNGDTILSILKLEPEYAAVKEAYRLDPNSQEKYDAVLEYAKIWDQVSQPRFEKEAAAGKFGSKPVASPNVRVVEVPVPVEAPPPPPVDDEPIILSWAEMRKNKRR